MGSRAPRGFGGRAVLVLISSRAARAAEPYSHGVAHSIPRLLRSRTLVWFLFFVFGGVVCLVLGYVFSLV